MEDSGTQNTQNGVVYKTLFNSNSAITGIGHTAHIDVSCPLGYYAIGGGGYFLDSGGVPIPLYQSYPAGSGTELDPYQWRVSGFVSPDPAAEWTVSGIVYAICVSITS
jgi:hypothetical protein